MDEISDIIVKYQGIDLDEKLSNFDSLVEFSTVFYRDVAEIYDAVTRGRNTERNPVGFHVNDAAILGLLVRIWKILKEVVHYYEKKNAEIIGLLDRQVIEAAVTAKFLLLNGEDVIEDYRKCSYKSRLQTLKRAAESPEFFETPAGKRLLKSIRDKLRNDGFTEDSFEQQRKNRWRLQGKSFYQIFVEIEHEEFYKFLYGMPSEALHGSWNESLDYDLIRNDDGTFKAYPFYQDVDIRFVTPILRLCHDPYVLWLKRVDIEHEYLTKCLEWTRRVNVRLFNSFEGVYKDKIA